jgi:hypothetical protein
MAEITTDATHHLDCPSVLHAVRNSDAQFSVAHHACKAQEWWRTHWSRYDVTIAVATARVADEMNEATFLHTRIVSTMIRSDWRDCTNTSAAQSTTEMQTQTYVVAVKSVRAGFDVLDARAAKDLVTRQGI